VDSTQLYQRLLGLEAPWKVSEVILDESLGELLVRVINTDKKHSCPTCNASGCSIHDHAASRRWRHLDSCQMATIIECSIPRVRCDEHGVSQLPVPWAGAKSRFTLLFEARAIDAMLMCPRRSAAELLAASEPSLRRIAEHAVARGLAAKEADRADGSLPIPTGFSVDEKSWRGRRYATIIGDPKGRIVEDILPGRSQGPLEAWFKGLGTVALHAIDSVTMDFHDAFRSAVRASVPAADAKIVHDKFHLVKAANDAMEQTRRAEMALYRGKKDKDSELLLKKARYSLLRSGTDLQDKHQERVDLIDEWFHDTGDAYRMKESIRQILSESCPQKVQVLLKEWASWVLSSAQEPMKKVARLVTRRMQGILNIFTLGKSNANAESLNARIQAVRVKSRGHRNYEAFKRDVMFHLGGLKLHPVFPA